jgi:hypothetical protein
MSSGLAPVRRGKRVGQVRANGMRSVGRITRLALAASLALTAAFSVLTDLAFPGRSSATPATTGASGSTSSVSQSAGGVRVALPPRGGGNLAPPVAPPVPQPAVPATQPVATSGGS